MHTFLLAEDSKDEAVLFTRGLGGINIPCSLQVVRNHSEVMAYLSGSDRFSDRQQFPLPDFLLLDIKPPRPNGLELLEWIRRDSPLKELPVVAFTRLSHRCDLDHATELGADACFIKPDNQLQLNEMLRGISQCWLRCGAFPENPLR